MSIGGALPLSARVYARASYFVLHGATRLAKIYKGVDSMKRTLALILSLVMCLGLLAGCGDKKTDDGQTDGKTLVVGTQNFDGKFSPFFYTNDYENQVMGMVFDDL